MSVGLKGLQVTETHDGSACVSGVMTAGTVATFVSIKKAGYCKFMLPLYVCTFHCVKYTKLPAAYASCFYEYTHTLEHCGPVVSGEHSISGNMGEIVSKLAMVSGQWSEKPHDVNMFIKHCGLSDGYKSPDATLPADAAQTAAMLKSFVPTQYAMENYTVLPEGISFTVQSANGVVSVALVKTDFQHHCSLVTPKQHYEAFATVAGKTFKLVMLTAFNGKLDGSFAKLLEMATGSWAEKFYA